MKLSPKYSLDDWNRAFEGAPDWEKAIDIVEDRIQGRFIRWIDPMLRQEFAGFAIVALDCLLLETLHGFRAGNSTFDSSVRAVSGFQPPGQRDNMLPHGRDLELRCTDFVPMIDHTSVLRYSSALENQ
jgi:hypothetical protein